MGLNGIIDINNIRNLNKTYKVNQSDLSFPYEDGYITASDVYSVVSRIAKNGKSLNWILKLKGADTVEEIKDGKLYDLIQNPNINQTRAEFTELALLYLLLSGENFQKKIGTIGFPADTVELLNPQFIEIITRLEGGKNNLKGYNYNYGGRREGVDVESISFLKYANPTIQGFNSMRGLSPLVAGYLTLVGLNNNQRANATILENQGVAGILSNEGDVALTEKEREQSQGVLDKLISGVRNFGKVLQSSSKVKYTRLGLDPTQLKLIESKVLKMRDLCNIYDTKSILFNDVASSSYNNLILAEKSFWNSAVIPNTKLIVNNFNKGIVTDFNRIEFPNGNKKYFIELDTTDILSFKEDEQKAAQKGKMITESIVNVLSSQLTDNQKISTLITAFNFTVEESKQIVNGNFN